MNVAELKRVLPHRDHEPEQALTARFVDFWKSADQDNLRGSYDTFIGMTPIAAGVAFEEVAANDIRGSCFMAGGKREALGRLEPILLALATEGGYVHAGSAGAGHFTKLVHNGIEFGMLQTIGEGLDLLTHYHERLDLAAVLRCWRHGSVIRGWLMDLMESAYGADPQMDTVTSYIEDTGEVNWLVSDAVRMEVPVPVISQSVMQLFASRDDREGLGARDRHDAPWLHPPGPHDGVKRERQEGRVGDIFKPDPR